MLRSKSTTTTLTKPGRLWKGPGTQEIPVELFAINRERLIERLRQKIQGKVIVVLQGGDEQYFYDTDVTYAPFRQESFFMWSFGVVEPGCYGAIDIVAKTSYLFIPWCPENYKVWKGPLLSPQGFIEKYRIHYVHYTNEIATVLKNLNPTVLLTLRGVNVDSNRMSLEAQFPEIDKFQVNNSLLYNEMVDLRVFKTDLEIEVLGYVNEVSSEAHCKVMRFAKAGIIEYQCEAEFLHYCHSVGGCRNAAFTCVCASNDNTVYMNYGHAGAPNNKMIEPGDLCLFHMGAQYFGYCADIACTFPVSGKFTPQQKVIYEAVLNANVAVFEKLRPGMGWTDMHFLAQRVLLSELKKAGILKGEVEQMVGAGLGPIFQPHGVGHFLGLDVHDVGGFIGTKRCDLRGAEALRTTRVLEERMVITIQTGCYFNDSLLDQALKNAALSRFLVPDVVKKFRGFGGINIEDNVLITKRGAVNLTKVPRTVKEVETWLAGHDNNKYTS